MRGLIERIDRLISNKEVNQKEKELKQIRYKCNHKQKMQKEIPKNCPTCGAEILAIEDNEKGENINT